MYWIENRSGCDGLDDYHVHESLIGDYVDHHTFDILHIRDSLLQVVCLRECVEFGNVASCHLFFIVHRVNKHVSGIGVVLEVIICLSEVMISMLEYKQQHY